MGQEEINAELKPLLPKWQLFLGMVLLVLAFGAPGLSSFELKEIVFYTLVIAGMSALLTYVFRDKTLRVRLRQGEGCVLLYNDTRADPGKLVPLSIKQKTDKVLEVEREGTRWEIKRIELRFPDSPDATRARLMLGFHRKSGDEGPRT